jgi:hypothetical protein
MAASILKLLHSLGMARGAVGLDALGCEADGDGFADV